MHAYMYVNEEEGGRGCMQEFGEKSNGPCPVPWTHDASECVKRKWMGVSSGTYLPEPVRPWRRRQQQSWYAAGPLLDRNAKVGRSYTK